MNVKSWPIEVLVELLGHSPLKSEKLQFVGWVMGLSLIQAPTSIGDDDISPIITGLIEESPRQDPKASVCSWKGLEKSA